MVDESREDRFARLYEVQPDGCWYWIGSIKPEGYGAFDARGRWLAHRFSWELINGPIPEGLDIDHSCHNDDDECSGGATCLHRRCVNPDHLEPVSRGENLARSPHTLQNRPPAEVCKYGHPLSGDNLLVTGGRRRCRICNRRRSVEFQARQREAKLNG